jgi:eukaryotic-like serine/threonine-protein kinase
VTGAVVSHYRMIEKIGEGGMGVVYRALDTRLDRLVALKVLKAERVTDPDRQRRFVQEAKTASALNNPHIVTIYDIDVSDGVSFIAMELLEGQTLQALIPPQGMAPEAAVKFAVQMADALAAVHARGIIHRDFKPHNVMVLRNSHIKVLDFGLAKLTEHVSNDQQETLTVTGSTTDGAVVGTCAYMSPEQAEAKPLDGRSDIFSFGIVLYQMLAGRPPFQGGTKISILSAILHEVPPPIAQNNSAVPPELERIAFCCLEKDPQKRFQSASDLKMALEWIAQDSESGKLLPIRGARSAAPFYRSTTLAATLFLIGALLTAAAVSRWISTRSLRSPPPNAEMITSDSGLTCSPALSPDGKLLAYISDRSGDGNVHIWVKQLPDGVSARRTNAPVDDYSPHFTPDGLHILFERVGTGIFSIPAIAGEEKLIADRGQSPRCSPDGRRVVYWVGNQDDRRPAGRIFVIPFGEGSPTQLASDFADARYPLWAPGGKHLLFQGVRAPGEQAEWWVLPTEGGPAIDTGILKRLRTMSLSPHPGPSDWVGEYLLFSGRNTNGRHVWSVRLDNPVKPSSEDISQLTFGTGEDAEPSLTQDGRVAFASYHHRDSLWRLTLNGTAPAAGSIRPLRDAGSLDTHPSLSANGKALTFLSGPPNDRQVWIRDLPRATERPLTMGRSEKSSPAISVDGSSVAYSVLEGTRPSIYVVSTANSQIGAPSRVCQACGAPADWTRDGKGIFYVSGTPSSIQLLDLATGRSQTILEHPKYGLSDPRISRDNHWIAFAAAISADRTQLFVAQFRPKAMLAPEAWVPITGGESWDSKPAWQTADTLIFYTKRDNYGCLWKQHLNSVTKRPDGAPAGVYHFHTLRHSPRTLFDSAFAIAVAPETLILNQVEITGNIWTTSLPQRQ